ncbi:hypothetical protein STEG23_017780, partial [Scotinomys teguina]
PYWRQSKEYSQLRAYFYEAKFRLIAEEADFTILTSLVSMHSDMHVTLESSD